MNTKHTPGPWGFHPHMDCQDDGLGHITNCDDFDACTIYIGRGEVMLAEVQAFDFRGSVYSGYPKISNFDEARANARLIAAAPELLDAAKLVIAWYESEDDHSKADFYQRLQMCRDSEAALRAAIAKATGETS
jgi:hypothetical protein